MVSTNEGGRRLHIEVDAKFIDGPKVHSARVNSIRDAVAEAFVEAVEKELPGSAINLTVSAEWQYLLYTSSSVTSAIKED